MFLPLSGTQRAMADHVFSKVMGSDFVRELLCQTALAAAVHNTLRVHRHPNSFVFCPLASLKPAIWISSLLWLSARAAVVAFLFAFRHVATYVAKKPRARCRTALIVTSQTPQFANNALNV